MTTRTSQTLWVNNSILDVETPHRFPALRKIKRSTTVYGWCLRRAACAAPLPRPSRISTVWLAFRLLWWASPVTPQHSPMSFAQIPPERWSPPIASKTMCRDGEGAKRRPQRIGSAGGAPRPHLPIPVTTFSTLRTPFLTGTAMCAVLKRACLRPPLRTRRTAP